MRCSKWVLYSLLCVLLASGAYVYAAGQLTPAARGTEGAIAVQEVDGSPNVGVVTGLKVTNGSLTDNGDGTVTLATSGAANVEIGTSTITGGVPSGLLYVGTGPVLQQASITGLVLGAGASAPAAYGGTSCTNQVPTALNASGAATCTTLTSAYVDTSVITDSSLAAGVKTFLGTPSSANLAAAVTNETGTGALVFGTGPTITLENGTGLPISTGVSGLGANVATFLGTASSANFAAAITDETGTGLVVLGTAPTISSAVLSTKVNLPRVTAFPGTPASGDTVIITDDSAIGACDSAAGSAVTLCQYNGTSWVALGDGGAGGGSIGGSTGATDNAVIRANGTGGSTIQSSGCTISDTDVLTCPGGFVSGTSGTGTLTLLEGAAPGAGAGTGEHNLYFDSSDSKLKSHENGGSVITYVRTADTLASLNTSTSADLAGVLNDETGSGGGFVRATSPTLVTPSFTGSPTLADGATWTFNPNATSSGFNYGSHAGDPSAPNNGDCWYNSTSNKVRCRENGSTVDAISTGAGTGDVTDVNQGAGIAVATPGGPAPTVSWDSSTFVDNVTMWNAANASRTWTANLSGATDPTWTYSNALANLSTGALQVGGVAVPTISSTDTLTNKTIDAEGTGNVLTVPRRIWLPVAGCNNATAGSIWDLPTTNAAVPACVTGTNTQKGVLDFADGSNLSAQMTWRLPSTWTGNVDINVKWFTAATTGDVVWQTQTICVADGETDDPAFNTADAFAADTAKGTANQTNDASDTSITMTGCAAGELLHLKLFRDSAHASDTLAATARLIGVELVIREAL